MSADQPPLLVALVLLAVYAVCCGDALDMSADQPPLRPLLLYGPEDLVLLGGAFVRADQCCSLLREGCLSKPWGRISSDASDLAAGCSLERSGRGVRCRWTFVQADGGGAPLGAP